MKNYIIIVFCFIFGIFAFLGISTLGVGAQKELNADSFLRIHIRANSNLDEDQNIKYVVKEKIVEYLTPKLAEVESKQDAMQIVAQNLDNLSEIASIVLSENGYKYSAKANLTREYFPVRAYDDVVLNSGEYDSLIINLGEAQGNNWWCVVYPPLCFVATQDSSSNVVYRSKLLEIINSFFGG